MNTKERALAVARELFKDDEQQRSAAMVIERAMVEANSQLKQERDQLSDIFCDCRPHVEVLADWIEATGGYLDSDEGKQLAAAISMLVQAFPLNGGTQTTYRDLVAVFRQERDDYARRLAEYDAETVAIASLTADDVIKAEEMIDKVFSTAFETNDPPMLDYARIKMEMKRLRLALLAGRRLFESLEEPCVGCGVHPGEAHQSHCRLFDWWSDNDAVLRAHRFVTDAAKETAPAPEAAPEQDAAPAEGQA